LPSGASYWTVVDRDFEVVEALDAFLQFGRFARGMAVGTTRVYAGNLARFADWCWGTACGLEDVMERLPAFVIYLRGLRTERQGSGHGRRLSEDRIDHVLTSTRSFLVWAARNELLAREELSKLYEVHERGRLPGGYLGEFAERVARPVHRLARTQQRAPRAVGDEEFARLFVACCEDRDRFLLVLLRFAGLRVGEAVGLLRSDLHLAESSVELGCVVEGPHLHVIKREGAPNGADQKSRRERVVPANAYVQRFYWRYLEERVARRLGESSDYVFVNYARPAGAAMRTATARKRLARLAQRAGIGRPITPHMLRHSFAVALRRGDAHDLRVVQELLGHTSIESTAIYARVGLEELRTAVQTVGLPLAGSLEPGLAQ
jgi:site-specific recombinase XerD